LLVLRHAETQEAPPGGDDFSRPLTSAGQQAASSLAPVVNELSPELVVHSPALRVEQTLAALRLPPLPTRRDPELYGAEAEDLLELVRGFGDDDDPGCVLLVGHNPGVHHLVLELTGGERLPGFPPAALAVVDLEIDEWWEVSPGTGRLAELHVPDRDAR
jgi:phosphohistidine phosphatase